MPKLLAQIRWRRLTDDWSSFSRVATSRPVRNQIRPSRQARVSRSTMAVVQKPSLDGSP